MSLLPKCWLAYRSAGGVRVHTRIVVVVVVVGT